LQLQGYETVRQPSKNSRWWLAAIFLQPPFWSPTYYHGIKSYVDSSNGSRDMTEHIIYKMAADAIWIFTFLQYFTYGRNLHAYISNVAEDKGVHNL